MSERQSVERGRSDGWVYFMAAGQGDIKIGWARDPDKRLRELQVGNPKRLKILGVIPGSRLTEKEIHRYYAAARVTGEWFKRKAVMAGVNHLIDTLGFRVVRAANSRTIPEGNRVGQFFLFVPRGLDA